jgi:hypothetical protein
MIPIAVDNSLFVTSSDRKTASLEIVRGRESILKLKPKLVSLCERCQHQGAMDYLEYFLSRPQFAVKIPSLILVSGDESAGPETLEGAVLLYEHRVLGLGSRIFVTDFHAAHRSVIALPGLKTRVATMACEALMRKGALVAQISFLDEARDEAAVLREAAARGKNGWMWATMVREMVGSLPLENTYDETLALMGKHTRRNLRYYRRRAEAELGCHLVVEPVLTVEDYLEVNRASTYPVEESLARWRFDSLAVLPGRLWMGIQDNKGQWLSLIAGRSHHGITEIDWQKNRSGLPEYSLSTVMRSYLLEHEIAKGTRRLFFEGGTPHPIRHALEREKVVDLVVLRRSPAGLLLRSLARRFAKDSSYLTRVLADRSVDWSTF